jgi:hypothetical protein
MICLPVLLFATIFLALFGANLLQRDGNRALNTFIFGAITMGALALACEFGSHAMGWIVAGLFSVAITLYMLVYTKVITL